MLLHTTDYNMTLTTATKVANHWTKCESSIDGFIYKDWRSEYNTAIKGEPADSRYPEECWAVTNKFDPRVARGE